MSQITRLVRKLDTLSYRVEQFGDLGAERERDEVRKELDRVLDRERGAVAC